MYHGTSVIVDSRPSQSVVAVFCIHSACVALRVCACDCAVGVDEGSSCDGVVGSQSHRAYDWRLQVRLHHACTGVGSTWSTQQVLEEKCVRTAYYHIINFTGTWKKLLMDVGLKVTVELYLYKSLLIFAIIALLRNTCI